MKIGKQKWIVGTITIPQNEIEIINEANQSRVARITITDFKSLKQARKIAKVIASLPDLLREKK
jgi:hypothetical protein